MANSDVSVLQNNEESLQRYKDILLNRGMEGLRDEINQNAAIWKSTKVNVAITGNTGSGKSTFINALLNLEDNRAEEGIVETTKEIKSFCSPNCPNVFFYDLPGVGTQSFPKEKYVETVKLDTYDFFIIISKSRFTENDIWLVENIKKYGKRFYFVRSHMQEEIDNDRQSHPMTHRPESVLETIENDCRTNLENKEKYEIFFIDSYEMDKFDFPKLTNTLIRQSGMIQASHLAICLAPITQEVLDMKLSALILRLLQEVVPRFGRDVITAADCRELLLNEIAYYRKVFDIDDKTLKNENLFSLSQSESQQLVLQVNMEHSMLLVKSTLATSLCAAFIDDMTQKRSLFGPGKDEIQFLKTVLIGRATIEPLLVIMHGLHKLASDLFENVGEKFAEMHLLS